MTWIFTLNEETLTDLQADFYTVHSCLTHLYNCFKQMIFKGLEGEKNVG